MKDAERNCWANEPGQPQHQAKSLREELRREHQFVGSTGVISKWVMALAFGVVFLLLATLLDALWRHWLWAFIFGAIGAPLVAWALVARKQVSREPTR